MPIWGQALVALALFAGALAILWNIGMRNEVKKIALALVIEAEKKFGGGTGPLKYEFVIGNIYPKLPAYVRMFITEKQLDIIIEEAVQLMKDKLAKSLKLYESFYKLTP